jgi:uncharacterized protein YdeI (YjbR/CyaY-like superfamily)
VITSSSSIPRKRNIEYIDAVEEALCFGWIDGIEKKLDNYSSVQRFTPRRKNSNWTELNKERVRRLIALGRMTPAGMKVLPDLSLEAFRIPDDILTAIKDDPCAWEHFQDYPDLYKRVRIGYIEEMRKNAPEFAKRLSNFIRKTCENKLYGNWNDSGRLLNWQRKTDAQGSGGNA